MPTIRTATDDDRALVASLTSAYASEMLARATATPTELVILAENDAAEGIGFLGLSFAAQVASGVNTGEVTALYVTPARRREKIAMLLLAEAERVSRDGGVTELTVTVDDNNTAAALFFRAMSYMGNNAGFKKQLPPKRSAKSRRAEG